MMAHQNSTRHPNILKVPHDNSDLNVSSNDIGHKMKSEQQ